MRRPSSSTSRRERNPTKTRIINYGGRVRLQFMSLQTAQEADNYYTGRSYTAFSKQLLVHVLYKKCSKLRDDIRKQKLRTITMSTVIFNLNFYSDETCLNDFRFLSKYIVNFSNLLYLPLVNSNMNRYSCYYLVSFCIVLKLLESPATWFYIEETFGIWISVLSEMFWETIEHFCKQYGHLVTDFYHNTMK